LNQKFLTTFNNENIYNNISSSINNETSGNDIEQLIEFSINNENVKIEYNDFIFLNFLKTKKGNNWKQFKTNEGKIYFANKNNNKTQWHLPDDYKLFFIECKKKDELKKDEETEYSGYLKKN
jgi:hypothetical protein